MQWKLLATGCGHCLWCNCNKLKLFLLPLDTSEQGLWVRLINDNSSSSNRPQTRDNKQQRHALKQSFLTWFFTNKPDAIVHKFETYECCSALETPPCLSNVPTRPTSSLARLITWCTCFVIVTHCCYHKSVGMRNIVMQHIVETQLFVPFLCSGFDLASCSLGCTLVPGLELGAPLGFLDCITDEIGPVSRCCVILPHSSVTTQVGPESVSASHAPFVGCPL